MFHAALCERPCTTKWLSFHRDTADTTTLSVSPTSTSVSVGDTFAIQVNVANASDLYVYEFDVSYDPAVLQFSSVAELSFLSDTGAILFIPGTVDPVAGTIAFNTDSLLSAIPGISGNGSLVRFDFTALTSGTSSLTISNEILFDSTFTVLSDTTTAGSVVVSSLASPVPEPSNMLLFGTGILGAAGMILRKLMV
jgi:hypothetical protein